METANPLDQSIQYVKGVGPKFAQLLARKGISTLEDAIYFLPRAYEDRRRLTPLGQLVPKQTATVYGKIVSSRAIRRFSSVFLNGGSKKRDRGQQISNKLTAQPATQPATTASSIVVVVVKS